MRKKSCGRAYRQFSTLQILKSSSYLAGTRKKWFSVCGGGQRISEKWNPYDEREDQYERRKEFSDFRNSSQSTLNYLRSCLETSVESLEEHGASKKEILVFVRQIVKTEYSEDEPDEDVSSDKEALQQLRMSAKRLEESSDPVIRFLGNSIESQLQQVLNSTQTSQTNSNKK